MLNVKDELIEALQENGYNPSDIKCAEMIIQFDSFGDEYKRFTFPIDGNIDSFLYDILGYGYDKDEHYISGTIWMKDGAWFERDEDFEDWRFQKCPEIPDHLKKGDSNE